jgi:hypothetical protein
MHARTIRVRRERHIGRSEKRHFPYLMQTSPKDLIHHCCSQIDNVKTVTPRPESQPDSVYSHHHSAMPKGHKDVPFVQVHVHDRPPSLQSPTETSVSYLTISPRSEVYTSMAMFVNLASVLLKGVMHHTDPPLSDFPLVDLLLLIRNEIAVG